MDGIEDMDHPWVERPRRRHADNHPIRRWDDWIRWLLGGLIAGLIAYAGIGARLAAVETKITGIEERAREDRDLVRRSFDIVTNEVRTMRQLMADTAARPAQPTRPTR